jgi:hypothetical protein
MDWNGLNSIVIFLSGMADFGINMRFYLMHNYFASYWGGGGVGGREKI